jgi:hypothetical protein
VEEVDGQRCGRLGRAGIAASSGSPTRRAAVRAGSYGWLRHNPDTGPKAGTSEVLGIAHHHHLGHHAQAIACYQFTLETAADLAVRNNLVREKEASLLAHLADTHEAAGDLLAARQALQRASLFSKTSTAPKPSMSA